jgi:integrator complex subunit 1
VSDHLLFLPFIFQLNRPAHELLMSVALNCTTHSLEDIEVISNIVKMRLKTKQLAGHYITCVR